MKNLDANLNTIKNILTRMGYIVKAGIDSKTELFAFDNKGHSITCLLDGEDFGTLTTVSNLDIENETHPEYFTVDLDDEDAVIVAISYAMSKDESLKAEATKNEIQDYINGFGIGMNVTKLASNVYWQMKNTGHDACIINDRYVEVDGRSYQFIKSRKNNAWIVREF